MSRRRSQLSPPRAATGVGEPAAHDEAAVEVPAEFTCPKQPQPLKNAVFPQRPSASEERHEVLKTARTRKFMEEVSASLFATLFPESHHVIFVFQESQEY